MMLLGSVVFLLWDFGEIFGDIKLKFAFLLALLSIVAGAKIIHSYIRKTGILFDGYILIWLSFIFVYPVSAACHLINTKSKLRGFYDMVQSGNTAMTGNIYYSLFVVVIAFVALRVGLGQIKTGLSKSAKQLRVNCRLLLAMGVFFTCVSAIGTMKLFGGFPSLQVLLTIDTLKEIGGGTARYVFISHWFCWGMIFLTVYFVHTSAARMRSVFLLWFVLAACATAINLFWTGSRGAVAVSLLPGLLLLQRLRPKYLKLVLVQIGVLVLVYFLACTYFRSKNFTDYKVGEYLMAIFDWHVGRFSMIGLGIEIVQSEGRGSGATLFNGFVNAINAPSTLLKLPQLVPVPQSVTSIVGNYLRGDPKFEGIVPGNIFDFYYNFGLIGVAAGYFIIGIIVQKGISVMRKTGSMGAFIFWSYVIVTLSVCGIPGTATGWIYYLATTGFPAICFWGCEAALSYMRLSSFGLIHQVKQDEVSSRSVRRAIQ
jgi:oligosaccharide repeat unit polymerase